MMGYQALILIEEIGRKGICLSEQDRRKLTGNLAVLKIPESSRFYEELPFDSRYQATIEESSDLYHYFSLRRVLRNANVKTPKASLPKAIARRLRAMLDFYSSTDFTRMLREDKQLVEAVSTSFGKGNPFSLLGKLESFETSGEDLFVSTKPLLIIPDISEKEREYVREWENQHISYERESVVLGLFPVRTKISCPRA